MSSVRGQRTLEQEVEFQRLFEGLPVFDAAYDMRVAVFPDDAEKATRGDPANCALARACKRQFGTTKALFFRRVAYVEIPDADGKPRVERFKISLQANDLLREFDLTGVRRSGGAFVMRAPKKSETLDAMRAQDRKYRKALLMGERVVDPGMSEATKRGLQSRSVTVGGFALRDGAGMVHFTEPTTGP